MKNSVWCLVFVLLLCGCRSKKDVTGYSNRLQVASEVSLLSEKARIDTNKTIRSEQLSENRHIFESIIVTEYDAESGKPIKETKTKRTIVQDSDKVASEEEVKGVSEVMNDSLNHFIDVSKMVDEETVKKRNGVDILSVIVGMVVSILFVYLLRKFRVN